MFCRQKSGLKLIVTLLASAMCFNAFPKYKVDTLCAYELSYNEGHLTQVVFNTEKELTFFLDSTGYKTSRVIKSMSAKPDFGKSVYFAFAGWPCKITNIVEKKDSLIVNYKEEYRDTKNSDGIVHSRPASIAVVYFIPFTKKSIAFLDETNCSKADTDSLK